MSLAIWAFPFYSGSNRFLREMILPQIDCNNLSFTSFWELCLPHSVYTQ